VDADVAVAGPDVVLEGSLLLIVQDVAGRVQPDDRVVLGEVRLRERGRVLGRVDREAVGGPDLLDGGDAGLDRVMAEAARLGEHEHLLERCRGCNSRHRQNGGKRSNQRDQPNPRVLPMCAMQLPRGAGKQTTGSQKRTSSQAEAAK
jgi:hypothetical protein